jgi:hypothetical protein
LLLLAHDAGSGGRHFSDRAQKQGFFFFVGPPDLI